MSDLLPVEEVSVKCLEFVYDDATICQKPAEVMIEGRVMCPSCLDRFITSLEKKKVQTEKNVISISERIASARKLVKT